MNGVTIVLAAGLLLSLAACREDTQTETPPLRPVLSAVVTVQTTDTLGPFAGTIEPRYKTDLGFRLFGRMVARPVEVGQVVRKGQEIATLDPAAQSLAVRSAEASVANATAQFANAQAESARQKDLAQHAIVPQAQYDLTQRDLETADANLTRARASLRKAKETLSFTRLDADFDGVVTARYAEPGQVLNAGQKVITLARPEVREAVIAVPTTLADLLLRPNDFAMTVDLDRVVSMKAAGVRAIDPVADINTRTHTVYLTLDDPPPAFRLGITISVTFSRPAAAHVDLPVTAILDKDGKTFVWIVDPAGNTVSLRAVTVSSRQNDQAVVTSGLSTGERIVTAGVHSLTPGQRIRASP